MTCFWDGILRKTSHNDFQKFGWNRAPRCAIHFAKFLKQNNKRTLNVRWKGEKLTAKQMIENYSAIKEYKIATARNGYYCSTFDPFLFLVCELFEVTIIHSYMGNKVTYTFVRPQRISKKKEEDFDGEEESKESGKDSSDSDEIEKNQKKKQSFQKRMRMKKQKKNVKKLKNMKIPKKRTKRVWRFASNGHHFYCGYS